MNAITKKLHDQALQGFYPVAERIAREGGTKNDIIDAFQKQVRIKTAQYYLSQRAPKKIGEILPGALIKDNKADSQAERIFYDMLKDRNIKFEFQYKIGPYRADYLFGGFLVVEIDGPQHVKEKDNARDEYMRQLGYKIIRVPTWVLVMDPEAIIDEIIEQMPKAKVLKFKKEKAHV